MPDLKNVVISKDVPVKSAPATHGVDVGFIWGSIEPFRCTVDFATLDDGWVKITNPAVWKDTGKAGWLKQSWCIVDDPTITQILVTIKDGVVSAKIVG